MSDDCLVLLEDTKECADLKAKNKRLKEENKRLKQAPAMKIAKKIAAKKSPAKKAKK